MKRLIRTGLSSMLALVALAAHAHIVLDVPSATAGSYYRGALRVTHGCSGSPVTQVIVTIPPGVQGAKPMPKPGWHIDIQTVRLAQPYVNHGRTVTEDVSEIRWTAQTPADYLQNAHYDEFVIFARLPETAGTIYWKTSQVCVEGRVDWHEIPGAMATIKLQSPAAKLEVRPAVEPEHAGHKH